MSGIQLRWQDFREGRFRLNCASIKFTENGAADVFQEGPGEVWQEDDGTLSFKCFSRDQTTATVDSILRRAALPVGQLIPRDAYYSMDVVAFDGAQWRADNVSPACNQSFTTGQVIITGSLRTLTGRGGERGPSDRFSIRMLFTGQRTSDWTALAESEIACEEIGCVIRIVLERESDALVEISSKERLPENFEVRVIEALRYVLARVVHVAVIEHAGDFIETMLISPVPVSKTRLFPPLVARSADDRANLRRLFERYLTFVHSQMSADFVHLCSSYLRNVCEASANSIEAEMIGLCVAVEGIANLIPYERSTADDTTIKAIRRFISDWLEDQAFRVSLRDRVNGMLSQLKNIPPERRLEPLVQTGQLDGACLNSWKRLRNKHVHPQPSKLEELDDRAIQGILDDVHRVYVCLYQLTFVLIGYQGTFSNYASDRFRVEAYPLRQTP
jgi:hypothetical protein